MDEQRFDELTRTLASGTSRRRVVMGLAGGALGGLVALFGGRPAARADDDDDDCKRFGKPCRKHSQCCSGVCLSEGGTCGCATSADCDDFSNACASFSCDPEFGQCFGFLAPDCVPCQRDRDCAEGVCLPDGRCGCTSNADCDDGNACTVDTCTEDAFGGGRFCAHTPIPGCIQCKRNRDCAGGTCCDGRCCPAGSDCGVGGSGDPVCCPVCRDNQCCDDIRADADGSQVIIAPAQCFGSRQQICSIGSCRVTEDANGEIIAIECDLPIIRPG